MDKWKPSKLEVWLITPNGDSAPFEIIGEYQSQDKLDPEICHGYVHYFRTTEGLQKFSAFQYSIKRIKDA